MLDKNFQAAQAESHRYPTWEASGEFSSDPCSNRIPHTVMMPPPNVTGSLHMGHALNMTLQDILTRYNRRRGRDALWQPGTDHAGIATQMVVERKLAGEGTDRHALGRDAFIDRVWQWKEESGGTITTQLRRLGATPDWPRERFTMDEGLSRAVAKVFVQLHKEGLIYKDKRLVNWDPKLNTAISDLEVEQREVKGNLWHFRYPVEGEPDLTITVATTRPETMLGDTGVAVHPEDERHKALIGKYVVLPLVGRRIPIVADEYADPEQGSGAVKITPAHDFNDFEVGRRQNLETINIMNFDGTLNDHVPEAFQGLDRFEARKKVVEAIDALGLLETIEPHTHNVPFGDRGGVPIEPLLTDQWYCDAQTLAKPAIAAVEDGRTVFVPKNWENTYFEWMRNIQPWCISRQLWWGHRIPAWYGPEGTIFVEETESEALAAAEAHFGRPVVLERDPDVLDTWFSSALWPFSTLGWPDQTDHLRKYYPGDVLVTGFDIIFFWVARMMMMGLHFMGDVPFREVYIHALVRDEKGQKMSKSKGNVIDPLELIDGYGADSLRLTLTAMAAQGRDIKLSTQRVEGYRNFVTKIWNAARYAEMNQAVQVDGFDPKSLTLTVNRWIVGELSNAAASHDAAMTSYKFNESAGALYQFTWHTFCDWYLEFSKPILNGDEAEAAAETRATTGWVLQQIISLLNPIMPYVTEELWERLGYGEGGADLLTLDWPDLTGLGAADASEEMGWVVRLISAIRGVRAEMNVPAGAKIPALLREAAPETVARLERHRGVIERLARLSELGVTDAAPERGTAQAVLDEATILLPLAGVIDLDQEKARLSKEIDKLDKEISKTEAKLANEKFVSKAPAEVVEEQRTRLEDHRQSREKLRKALADVDG